MNYPQLTEYKDSILSPQDNFALLRHLRPVLDSHGDPVMSSGNFAVVFKMTDGDKYYAVKCFIKEQEGRAEAYSQICDYLKCTPSPYMVHTDYLEKELFVDNNSDDTEFPVLLMDWVDGMTLDNYMKTIRQDEAKRVRLADEFRQLTFWLMGQEFAHGDLKPDNIIVTDDGRLVLVDYDGMLVPTMQGRKARELGTPLYRFKGRTLDDFDEYTDDYPCVFIMLVLMRNAIDPVDFDAFTSPDVKEILPHFSPYYEDDRLAPYIAAFLLVASRGRLDRQMLYPLLARRSNSAQTPHQRTPFDSYIRPIETSTKVVSPQPRQPQQSQLTFTVKGVTFEMIPVEGGTFTMGATPEQGGDAYDREETAHRVTLNGYAIGKHEVTQALWQAVMGGNPSYFKGDNLPVECVSWNDCQEFINKLNSITGRNFRLPTEAEWEFAARGGKKSKGYKYSGSNNLDEVAWYNENSGDQTHPVGTKKPNELGIYDMSGNVWEWCADWYGDYSSSPSTDPTGPTSGSIRVYRGGSWSHYAWLCRVSYRNWDFPDFGLDYLGLRLVLPQF